MSYYTLFVFQHKTIAGTGGRRLVKASGSDVYFCIEYIQFMFNIVLHKTDNLAGLFTFECISCIFYLFYRYCMYY